MGQSHSSMTPPGGPAPFELHVADEVLEDLRARLTRVRWPDEPPNAKPWQFGTDRAYLRELVDYWRDEFDWRAQEARLNQFHQYTAPLAGIDLHFIHEPGRGPGPLPLLLSHGWPGSFWEFHTLIPLLTDPARFGADAADAFTVVAPSLPGFGLSFQPNQSRFGIAAIGDAFFELMRHVLGYEHFAAQGGDWGASVSSYLGFTYPQHVTGIHLNYIMDQAGGYRELVRSANLLPVRREPVSALPADEQAEEAAYRAELDHWLREEIGYSTMQGTKPQTLAYALTDSPVGLAAWIVEKFRSWSDCDGQVERCFSKDDLLTNIMLYWSTGAIGSSFWPYYAQQHEGWHLPDDQRVEVPTAYQSFPFDILHPPRARADRAFNIQRWTVSPTGGHFAALEKPQALAEDIRAFFRPLR